ncbi:MAG: 3-phosphoshikimate 1-carboxyvinyltransferase [Bacteroidales bacterium]|nr:3-phosphoshikimate 1-carboxyvinyltransferase [Bacteroidales bacterium]
MIYQVYTDDSKQASNRIELPASKSLSNRALIIRALCKGECQIDNLSDCDDTRAMLSAFEGDKDTIDIGAAGTSMRFLTAYLACTPGKDVVLTGSDRMKERPIRILVEALQKLGADIEYSGNEGFPPLHIRGKQLEGGELSIDGSTSSQYISALLMIAPTLNKGLKLTLDGQITSRPYIEMTLSLMQHFGVESSFEGNVISIAPQNYQPASYRVESDWSAASYWYETMLLANKRIRTLTLAGLKADSLQGDSRVAEYFTELGIDTKFSEEGAELTYSDRPKPQKVEWDLSGEPDLAQTLIASCAGLWIGFHIRGLHTLRIKETDRLKALHDELYKFGVNIHIVGDDEAVWDCNYENYEKKGDSTDDLVYVEPPIVVRTYKDHRMAMAFAPLAFMASDLALADAVYIDDPAVVSKSYPDFWKHLEKMCFCIEPIDMSPEAFVEHAKAVEAKQTRVRSHAKFVLNTVIAVSILLLSYLFFKCCR